MDSRVNFELNWEIFALNTLQSRIKWKLLNPTIYKMSNLPAKFPLYSLPKLYNWHSLAKPEIKESGKIYQYFGANWWDLLMNDLLPVSVGKITVKTKDAHAIIFINIGADPIKMTNNDTGDIYNVLPGKRSTVNNTFDRTVTLSSSKPDSKMHLTKIGSMWIILLQVEQVKNGEALVKNSEIFNDFLLMTGIPDRDQYFNTVGLEELNSYQTEGWKYVGEQECGKLDFAEMLLEHWEKVNPKKKSNSPKPIPKVVQWIWLRKDINKNEYGPLKPVFYKFMNTWVERNPGFQFNVWTDNPNFIVPKPFKDVITVKGPSEIEKLMDKLPDEVRSKIKYLYKNHANPGARSDTLRQVILYFEGGIYSDVNDGACLAPMDKMCEKFSYIIGMEPVMYVNNAIIASAKKHPISQAMIAWLAKNSRDFVEEWDIDYKDAEQDDRDNWVVSSTGPIALTQVLASLMQRKKPGLEHSLILPSAWVYPNYWVADSPGVWLKPVSIFSHYDRRDYLSK